MEANDAPGKKLLLSGGGRCNFSNAKIELAQDYLCDDLDFLEQTFAQFDTADFLDYLKSYDIDYKIEENGRLLLASNKSKQLLEHFLQQREDKQIPIYYNHPVEKIEKSGDYRLLQTNQGEFLSKKIVIASGGKSFPGIGGSDFVIRFANHYHISYQKPYPALCGIQTQPNLGEISGSSVIATLQLWDQEQIIHQEKGAVLFTHRGISGPSAFNLSLWINYYYPQNFEQLRIQLHIPADQVSKRLLSHLGKKKKSDLILDFNIDQIRGLDQAKIMAGGILLQEVYPNFELKKLPNIFLI